MKAPEEVAGYEDRLAGIECRLAGLTWMTGTNVTQAVAVLFKLF